MSGIEGHWRGVLVTGGPKLRLLLHVSKMADGTLSATLDSLDQNARDLPFDSVVQHGSAVQLEMKRLNAIYKGTLDPEGNELAGSWQQGPAEVPLTFNRVAGGQRLERPQTPRRPFPYDEEEVIYENTTDHVRISGTLTLPHGAGPFPAVLLITGSGPQDRNESLMGHEPFLVLADYLARRGIAVLRSDDRGVGRSSAGGPNDTSENYAQDALAGVRLLKSWRQIDASKIGLIGHSEGGLIAPLAAIRSDDIAFIVLMAGPGVPGDELLARQSASLVKAMGLRSAEATTEADLLKVYGVIKQEPDNSKAEPGVVALLTQRIERLDEADRRKLADTETLRQSNVALMLTPWFRFFLSYDPRPTLMKVKCPVLAINGELDLQVAAEQNLPAIEHALRAGGNGDVTAIRLPRLNHLFQSAHTGAPSEYREIEETINPAALKIMGDWILLKAGSAPPSK